MVAGHDAKLIPIPEARLCVLPLSIHSYIIFLKKNNSVDTLQLLLQIKTGALLYCVHATRFTSVKYDINVEGEQFIGHIVSCFWETFANCSYPMMKTIYK